MAIPSSSTPVAGASAADEEAQRVRRKAEKKREKKKKRKERLRKERQELDRRRDGRDALRESADAVQAASTTKKGKKREAEEHSRLQDVVKTDVLADEAAAGKKKRRKKDEAEHDGSANSKAANPQEPRIFSATPAPGAAAFVVEANPPARSAVAKRKDARKKLSKPQDKHLETAADRVSAEPSGAVASFAADNQLTEETKDAADVGTSKKKSRKAKRAENSDAGSAPVQIDERESEAADLQEAREANLFEEVASNELEQRATPKAKKSRVDRFIDAVDAPAALSSAAYAQQKRTGRSTKTREAVILDAAGLTHSEMLTERSYYGAQLKWLQEQYGLEVKTGAFSKWEQAKIEETMQNFMSSHGFKREDVATLMAHRDDDHEHKVYDDMCKEVTRNLPARPLRFVRNYLRRQYIAPPACAPGESRAWTKEQDQLLVEARNNSPDKSAWTKIAKHVGRTPEACRMRWRDHADKLTRGQKDASKWTAEEAAHLVEKVEEVRRSKADDAGNANTERLPWGEIARLHADKYPGRLPTVCYQKWLKMNRSRPWDASKDFKEFIRRLALQKKAIKRDDFREVDCGKLTDDQWKWDRRLLREKWSQLLSCNLGLKRGDNIDVDFAARIAKLKDLVERGRLLVQSGKQHRDEVDYIESEEEA